MFSQLPKLLDRDFAIGFFLPSATLAGWIFAIIDGFGFLTTPPNLNSWASTAVGIAIVWLAAIALMALNRPIMRCVEGYGGWRLLMPLQRKAKKYFQDKIAPALAQQSAIDEARARGESPIVPDGHPDKLRYAVERYPDAEEWVLPTRFGNAFRALEVYSRVVYGIDAIPFWPRLQAVIPDHYGKLISEAKSQLDFCINLSVVSIIALLAYLSVAIYKNQFTSLWVPSSALATMFFGYTVGIAALGQFGSYVKSAFDLYRGDLAKLLGLDLPRSMEQERLMWETLSRMMIYRSAFRASQLTTFKPHTNADK
jgi:hypothetical protein